MRTSFNVVQVGATTLINRNLAWRPRRGLISTRQFPSSAKLTADPCRTTSRELLQFTSRLSSLGLPRSGGYLWSAPGPKAKSADELARQLSGVKLTHCAHFEFVGHDPKPTFHCLPQSGNLRQNIGRPVRRIDHAALTVSWSALRAFGRPYPAFHSAKVCRRSAYRALPMVHKCPADFITGPVA